MSDFGFSVYQGDMYGYDSPGKTWYERRQPTGEKGWIVSLPHQCDDWVITSNYDEPVAKEEAIEQLTKFISEASEALLALTEEREL